MVPSGYNGMMQDIQFVEWRVVRDLGYIVERGECNDTLDNNFFLK
jgi:hypothetical protein